ncbi:hypothetical protein OG760_07635 [Streptomyces sp. NBC_00963]|uniref:hypothetical protein n=1 Tax=Streptomyces sp. NBC_00963 TaxID=2903697 RepID=UPI003863830D|nr:hypothetical protein OG760_07635 [Streptomyces sp. NBC_00963]
MNSSDYAELETCRIELSANQFMVLFQVAVQLREIQEWRLADLGFSVVDRDRLLRVARAINGQLQGVSHVRIGIIDDAQLLSEPMPMRVDGSQVGPAVEVQAFLPLSIARKWPAAAGLVISALGPRELFLRTGYSFDEVQEAMAEVGG